MKFNFKLYMINNCKKKYTKPKSVNDHLTRGNYLLGHHDLSAVGDGACMDTEGVHSHLSLLD